MIQGKRQMRCRGHQIGQQHRRLARRRSGARTSCRGCGPARGSAPLRGDLRVLLDQRPLPASSPSARNSPGNSWPGRARSDAAHVRVRPAARCTRVRKSGHELAVDHTRVPAAVIEMQMRVHDDVDLLRRALRAAARLLQRGASRPAHKCRASWRRICRPRRSRPGSVLPPAADQQRIHAQPDAIALVRRRNASPTSASG